MKIRHLKLRVARKIVAFFVLSGALVAPSAVHAADFDVNLLVDPGFENVDTATSGAFGSVRLLDWIGVGVSGSGFAYNYAQNYDNRIDGFVPPGNDSASSTDYYYNGGSSGDGSIGGIYQDVPLDTGLSAAAIANGSATYQLYGWFSSYRTQGDFGNLKVDFLDSGNTILGGATVSDSDVTQWTIGFSEGAVPAGTTHARITAFGTAVSGEPDGYIDEVYFGVSGVVPEPSSAGLLGMALASWGWLRRRFHRAH